MTDIKCRDGFCIFKKRGRCTCDEIEVGMMGDCKTSLANYEIKRVKKLINAGEV